MTFNYSFMIQITSASVSLLASVVIIIMIKRATLKTPYRRLIFGLSAADVLHSFGLVTGPFASPVVPFASEWGMGNTASCTINGIFNLFGSLLAALYLLSLSIYFFLKLNKKMSDAVFSQNIEKKMHFLIISFVLAVTCTAFITTSFNPIPNGAVCTIARFPPGCANYPEFVGECTRGETNHTVILIYLVNVVVVPLCLLGVSVSMILLIKRAVQSERIYTLNSSNPHRSIAKDVFSCLFCCYFKHDQREDEADTDYVLRLYRRETVLQASLHIGSFLLTNLVLVYLLVINLAGFYASKPPAVSYIFSFLYPSMGLFNILIYCRPKVHWFRLAYPEVSWIRAFSLVVKAGGEVPSLNDPRALTLCCFYPQQQSHLQQQQQQNDRDSISRFGGGENSNEGPEGDEDEYLSEICREFDLSTVHLRSTLSLPVDVDTQQPLREFVNM